MNSRHQLRSVALFSRLSDEAINEVYACLVLRKLAKDEVLFSQGDRGDELYLIESGRIAIYAPDRENPGTEQPIRILEPPEILGEMALIDQGPRSLSAKALVESEIQVLNHQDFHYLVRTYPDMALAVMAGLSDRIRYTTDFLSEVRNWVQRIAAGDYGHQLSPETLHSDRSLAVLAADFAQMAAQVQDREQTLRREVEQLRIEIDQTKRKKRVEQIVSTDYFQALQDRAKELRRKAQQDEPGSSEGTDGVD